MFSMKGLSIVIGLISASVYISSVHAYWQDIDSVELDAVTAARSAQPVMLLAQQGRYLSSDIAGLRQALLNNDILDVDIPLPNGEMAVYRLELSPIAAQGLLDKFPEIRTFRGVDVNNEGNSGRFDMSPLGFRGMFRHDGELLLIDPQYVNDDGLYVAYAAQNAQPTSARPQDQVLYTDLLNSVAIAAANRDLAKGSSDGNLRTYRLAVAATGEYTQVFGGTVPNAIAAITTAINRVNEVYQNDLGIRLELVANNDLIVYTNPSTDPYFNTGSVTDLSNNQNNITAVIGDANYDIGHLFGTGSGGVATLGSVCDGPIKARGLTGLNNPTGDIFYIDFVAHEIGHQFGANHTFNGTSGSCVGGNRNATTAYEPGSGSTIMAYAGICGGENLQSNSDPYFHSGSIAEITRYIQTGVVNIGGTLIAGEGNTCGVITNPVNAVPDAVAGPDVTIPANTPFVLIGSATDADGISGLSYTWEQLDAGTASSSQAEWVDDGSRAIFRSIAPSNVALRYFPNLLDVLDGSLESSEAEAYPTTNRDLNFRFTVRDGDGETAFENKVVTVTTAAGPFQVSSPTTASLWDEKVEEVAWDVANTDLAPVNCAEVDIVFSANGGSTFVETLIANTANDGSQLVTLPTY